MAYDLNLLGPLSNPLKGLIEARLLSVARRDLGPVFAEVLRMGGQKNSLIVYSEEDLDEISCAGRTFCWFLTEYDASLGRPSNLHIEHFILCPAEFGLAAHALADVSPGKELHENAMILTKMLQSQLPKDDPVLESVLMNTAALFVTAGICETDTSDMGYGDDGRIIKERGPSGGRWKEGVRRARWAIESGEAWRQWNQYVKVSNSFDYQGCY